MRRAIKDGGPQDAAALEDVLTEGYAAALQLERRLERLRRDLEHAVEGAGGTASGLAELVRARREGERDLAALRAELARLQERLDAVRARERD